MRTGVLPIIERPCLKRLKVAAHRAFWLHALPQCGKRNLFSLENVMSNEFIIIFMFVGEVEFTKFFGKNLAARIKFHYFYTVHRRPFSSCNAHLTGPENRFSSFHFHC